MKIITHLEAVTRAPIEASVRATWTILVFITANYTLEISGGEPYVVPWSVFGSVDTTDLLTLENKTTFVRVPLGYGPCQETAKNKSFSQ